jgi:FAD/FMN-containing dehydrogenase/Fe-S oxidoreductase
MNNHPRIREIPYNYTSFSDREIVIRLLGQKMWTILNGLRDSRKTGQSARMLLEILGDIWMISRNPYLQEDLLKNSDHLKTLLVTMNQRVERIIARADGNDSVVQLVSAASQAVQRFADSFSKTKSLRSRIFHSLLLVTAKDNIDFSARTRVAHVTDATDWRIEYPFVILTPDSEAEVAPLVAACIEMGLTIIPRGGGTGYTGSGVPMHPDTVIINMERLDGVSPVKEMHIPGVEHAVTTINTESGAVTSSVALAAQKAGFVFAVDPTSKNASTIGGNVAMNAGGKKAVLWGTTLDNLISWRMVTPDGEWLEVTRLNHNLGKIHDIPEAKFQVEHFHADGITKRGETEQLNITAAEIRKPGLGKDVTNKFLGGLPGVQKEGCDGLITSACFLLHKEPEITQTVCLEFFGADLILAVGAIVEIKNYLDKHSLVGCAGLEHLDDRYVKAIGYNTKAPRGERPKMVLLADIVGDDGLEVEKAAKQVVKLAADRDGEGFIADTPEGRKRFWADRSRTAAIAAHTNAFKINEDIVIPLEKLAEYTAGIERINIEQSIQNKLAMVHQVGDFIKNSSFSTFFAKGYPSSKEGEDIVHRKRQTANETLQKVSNRWQSILSSLDKPINDPTILLTDSERKLGHPDDTLLTILLRRELRISYRKEVEKHIKNSFSGDLWGKVSEEFDAIHGRLRSNRLFVAMHMHAGDGNVHTNIPVNSNDYPMLQEAERMVDRIMELTQDLGGQVSGEHGIGLTKFAYLNEKTVADFVAYKNRVDPKGNFNRGKLLPGSSLDNAYTPSLRLVQQEALILRESDLGSLNDDFSNCLRCGKCQAVCSTHVPSANLLYSPRNKILATGLMIEAFLYEEQTRRGVSLHHFDEMGDLADHCTVCHRCVVPCPVNIDFGKITIHMRDILKRNNKKRGSVGSKLALSYLTMTDPRLILLAHKSFIVGGYAAQRLGYKAIDKLGIINHNKRPTATGRSPKLKDQVLPLLSRPLPDYIHASTARSALNIEDPETIPIIRDAKKCTEQSEAVFYFPGCGCERLFSDISLAVIALLYKEGVQTVLPPSYICCGFPQASSGDETTSRKISTNNRVLLHRVAKSLNYLDIKTVLVSCGTCLSQLESYQFEKIFPGCRLIDIHEYLAQKGLRSDAANGEPFLFHDPCHTPIKTTQPTAIASTLMGGEAQLSDRCCGEAGTFAVARPDISAQVRYKKSAVIKAGVANITKASNGQQKSVKMLTTCPSCYQGLDRYRDEIPIKTEFLAVELVKKMLGESWRDKFVEEVNKDGIERVLF